MPPETTNIENNGIALLTKYFDKKFEIIEQQQNRQYEKDSDTAKEIGKIREDLSELKQGVSRNTNNIDDLEKYKTAMDTMPSILIRLESIEKAMDKKAKNTLTIAIAICSPFLAVILGVVVWFLIYKPPTP